LQALETFIFPHFPPGFNALQIGGTPAVFSKNPAAFLQALVRKSFVALLQQRQKARARQMALMQAQLDTG